MTPGIFREDGDLRIRIMKGLVFTPVQFGLILLALVVLVEVPDMQRFTDLIRLNQWQFGLAFGMAALGLNLLLRHADLVSFGHAAFFGIGAYTAVLTTQWFGVRNFVVLLALAIVVGTLLSTLIGFFTLHHKGLYFALITLAFGQLTFAIFKGTPALGGTDGLVFQTGAQKRATLFGLEELNGQPSAIIYLFSLVVVLVGLLVMFRLARSPFGRALDAIGQQRTRARFLGLPVRRYVWTAFIISGIYGAIGGTLYAATQGAVDPANTLDVFVSGDILYMAILGGFQTLVGPVVGAVTFENLLVLADQISVTNLKGSSLSIGRFITGIVLLIIVFGFPKGIVGTIRDLAGGE